MPQFLYLGGQWLNVDKIVTVKFNPHAKTGEPCAEIWRESGKTIDLNAEETKQLVEYLHKNKV